ncbi:MAG: hydroxyacid dehydrogenase [Candidatus Eisenbacteria bacterium]|uniref:Hydroxyacid dehydrogenase n=1 Tax=Eiseniibacteriota bacterium TaxID=2212470 RepID=A0A538TVZ0_UNCEI|nr:MAG: hydroxyacid dehydrogenase [Candidatus Eisenbacteria bacterium]
MKVLVTDKADAKALDRIRRAGHEVVEKVGLQGSELVEALNGAYALLVRGGTKVTGEVLRATTTLKLVVRAGTGLDNVDAAAARAKGIVVHNTPNANAVSVAELVFGLLLSFERHLVDAVRELREGRWEKVRFAGHEIAGRRMGLIGFGRIAREVAARARAFQMEVWAYDPVLPSWPEDFPWVKKVELSELLVASDVLSLHVPLDDKTRGMIGADELSKMKLDAVLVNCARGGVVDEAALFEALKAKQLRGAILDVFATEPPGDTPLLDLPNVIATPHLGASTAEAQRRAGDEAAAILVEALAKL